MVSSTIGKRKRKYSISQLHFRVTRMYVTDAKHLVHTSMGELGVGREPAVVAVSKET